MYQLKKKLHEREKAYKSGNLRSIALDVTNKCNMNCRFCYAETFAEKTPVPLDILKKALDEAYEMGVCHYILQGGEVFADYERLKKIISMIYPDETYINIVSNGWAITKEKVEELKGLQVDKITFSLDSGIEKEHDENRMDGRYQRVLTAIELVKASGLLTGISTVVTHESLYSEGFKKAYEIAKDKGIRFDVQIAELYQNSPIMENGQTMVKRDLYRGNGEVCCPAGTEFMAITVDGNFLPCNFIQASLGNIREKSLKEMRGDLLKYCILGESDKYFNEIVAKYQNQEKPLDAYEVFGL